MTRTGGRSPTPVWLLLGGASLLGLAVGYLPSIAFALVLCAAIVLAGIMMLDPSLAVLAYTASRPAADMFVFVAIGAFSVGQLWGAGLVAVCAAYVLLELVRAPGSRQYEYSVAPLVFLGAYALATLSRPGLTDALTNTLRLSSWLFVSIVVQRIASEPVGRDRAVKAGIAGGCLMLVTILIAAVQNRYGPAYYAGEFTAIGQGPHGLASYAVLTCAFPLFLMVERRGRLWPLFMVGLLFIGIVGSLVRTALVAAMIMFSAYALIVLRGRRTRAVLGALLIIAVVGGVIFLAQDVILSRFSDVSYISSGGGSQVWAGSGRIGMWTSVWAGIWDHPGVILSGRGVEYSQELIFSALGVRRWAHNDYLEMLSTGGVFLLLSYLWLIYVWVRHGLRLRRMGDSHAQHFAQVYLGALAAFVFMAFFNGMALYQASIVMGVLAGIAGGWTTQLKPDVVVADAMSGVRA